MEFLQQRMQQSGFESVSPINKLDLTQREREVAELIIICRSNEEIAGKLFLSIVTVKKHVGSILRKARVKNRAQFIKVMLDERQS